MPGNDNLWVRQNKDSRVYRLDRTGIGYCDKDTIYKVHWRKVKEKFRDEVFVCVPRRLAVRSDCIDHHEGGGLGEISFICWRAQVV